MITSRIENAHILTLTLKGFVDLWSGSTKGRFHKHFPVRLIEKVSVRRRRFDKDGFSVWRVDFKYPKGLTQVSTSSNLIDGFLSTLHFLLPVSPTVLHIFSVPFLFSHQYFWFY